MCNYISIFIILILIQGLLRCMIRQGEFTSALMHVDGLQTNKSVF